MLGHKRTVLKALVAVAVMFSSTIICWIENMMSMVSTIIYGRIYDIRLILFVAIAIGIYRMFARRTKKLNVTKSGRSDIRIESTNDGRNDEESGKYDHSIAKDIAARKQKIKWSEVVRVRVVRNLNKYTMEEKNDCWYSKNEYQQMDQERKRATRITGIFQKCVFHHDIEQNFH